MILSGNQPYFLPYLPYWQLIHSSDLFLVGDDYNYIRRGWINRNSILVSGEPKMITLSVRKASPFRLINETELDEIPAGRLMDTVARNYCRAPFFEPVYDLFGKIIRNPERNLSDFLTASIKDVCAYLEINTKIGLSSAFSTYGKFRLEQRIYEYCRQTGADTYVNAIGGKRLYSFEDFRDHGISLKFLRSVPHEYCQRQRRFWPGLSILDVMMFNSVENIHEMLDDYILEGDE